MTGVSENTSTPRLDVGIIPTVIAERCVHTMLTQASCHDCVDACPIDAWAVDQETLAIDADRCDGCGLCAAACRQGAILAPNITAVVDRQNHDVFRLACEMADIEEQQGVIPCLHAIGLGELLQVYGRGTRRLMVTSGDCRSCIRRSVQGLSSRVAQLNRMLSDRKLMTMTLHVLPSDRWQQLSRKTQPDAGVPVISRRNFFRKVAESPLGLASGSSEHSSRQAYTPPAKQLPRTKADDIVPFVPKFDATKGNGCDACVRLCPHGAITLGAAVDGGLAYRIDAECCTGCGICTDVCTQNAVSVDDWSSQSQYTLDLDSRHCIACGAPFHVPVGREAPGDQCFICTQTNHVRNLYQVMD